MIKRARIYYGAGGNPFAIGGQKRGIIPQMHKKIEAPPAYGGGLSARAVLASGGIVGGGMVRVADKKVQKPQERVKTKPSPREEKPKIEETVVEEKPAVKEIKMEELSAVTGFSAGVWGTGVKKLEGKDDCHPPMDERGNGIKEESAEGKESASDEMVNTDSKPIVGFSETELPLEVESVGRKKKRRRGRRRKGGEPSEVGAAITESFGA